MGHAFRLVNAFSQGGTFSHDGIALTISFLKAIEFLAEDFIVVGDADKHRHHAGELGENCMVLIVEVGFIEFVQHLHDAQDTVIKNQWKSGQGTHLYVDHVTNVAEPAFVFFNVVGNDRFPRLGNQSGDTHAQRQLNRF